jgi:hypothetical protein
VSVTIGSEQKDQAWKYVKELMNKGLLTDASKVTCFVLGSRVDPADNFETTQANGRVHIHPMAYDVFVRRAERRMLGLRDRLHDAPFLQGKDLGGAPPTHPILFQEEMNLATAQSPNVV